MARVLSAEEIQVFKELFDSYDTDKGGSISVEEFAKVMSQSPGTPPSEEEVAKIIREVDLDGDGTVNFNEFITMMTGAPYPPPAPEDAPYAAAWAKIDMSLSRPVTPAQFREVVKALGELAPSAEEEANLVKDGNVTYQEFVQFMKNRSAEGDIINDYQ